MVPHPASLGLAVYVIDTFSSFGQLLLTVTVGFTLFHVPTLLEHALVAPFASFALA